MDWRQRVIVLVMDGLLIAELCLGMYMASQTPDDLTPVFMKWFLPTAIPTVLVAWASIRFLRRRATAVVPVAIP